MSGGSLEAELVTVVTRELGQSEVQRLKDELGPDPEDWLGFACLALPDDEVIDPELLPLMNRLTRETRQFIYGIFNDLQIEHGHTWQAEARKFGYDDQMIAEYLSDPHR